MARSLAVFFFLTLFPTLGAAQDRAPVRLRPTAAVGFSFAVFGLDTYGIALDVRGGVDVSLTESHELVLALGWTPSTIVGARLDVLSLDVGWKWRPVPRRGFFLRVTTGAAVGREALDVTLGNRHFQEVEVAPGFAGSLALGVTLFDHVELEVGYRQAVLFSPSEVLPLGSVVGSLGGRL